MGWAGAALGIVGSLLQTAAAVKANQRMGTAYRDELGRQSGFRNQATTAIEPLTAASDVGTANRQISEGAGQRNQAYAQANAVPLAIPTASSQSNASDTAYNKLVGGQRAQVGGYSDWALKQAISNIQTQRAMDQAINFAHGTAGVFPYRMYDAQHSGDTTKMIGQFLASLGGGMSGMGGGGEAPTMAPSFVDAGGANKALSSGYGQVPYGTSFNPYNNTNTYMPVNPWGR